MFIVRTVFASLAATPLTPLMKLPLTSNDPQMILTDCSRLHYERQSRTHYSSKNTN